MNRFKIVAIGLGLTIVAAVSSLDLLDTNETASKGLEDFIRGLPENPNDIEKILETSTLDGALSEVTNHHLEVLFSSEPFADALALEIRKNARVIDNIPESELSRFFSDFLMSWSQVKTAQGIKRLPLDEQRNFHLSNAKFLTNLSAADCVAFVQGHTPLNRLESVVKNASIESDLQVLTNIFALERASIFAELNDSPKYIPLTEFEKQSADTAISNVLSTKLEQLANGDELLEAAKFPENAPDNDLCEFVILTLETVVEVPGQLGDLVVKRYSEAQES
ncbi:MULTISPECIES: hypothetical protein [Halocynthiibacter]|uniref:Uncharacterized protein n=1 Tax=Halocynthiibacter halioticoli TaxID=2986804 RepID=A0AAE3IZW0_9RHOB|nr:MULTISPECIES: hypothetical protein [Halocynthiibacter]MCV6823561.1 hypothetical protein [Halocynthiibacter halioticoli]MCW4056562.1 hypothetical protein [Halocynthiibacter sp. SDUM655004]